MNSILGVQTYFSFHWGTASPAAWFDQAGKLGYKYIGFADNAALHGLPEIVKQAGRHKAKPLYGAAFLSTSRPAVSAFIETAEGYGNLCQLVTAWQQCCAEQTPRQAGGIPALDADVLRCFFTKTRLVSGLVFLANDMETWRTLRRAGAETYWRIGPTLSRPPREIPDSSCLFAAGPGLLFPGDFATHRLLRAIGGATTLDRLPHAEAFGDKQLVPPLRMLTPGDKLESPRFYQEKFALYQPALQQADRMAERLSCFAPSRETLYPPLPASPPGDGADTAPALEKLRALAYEGAAIRYGGIDAAARTRLERELDLIGRKGFAEYFLVVHDIVGRLAGGDSRKRQGRSITCGRGSGAASLVNYCLGVTNVDVLKHDLMFERFLNEARSDPPDIDVDFAWDERDGLLDKVFDSYGDERVGRVANHNRYDWRGAFRAAARALGYSDPEITRHLRESPSVYAADKHPGLTPPPQNGIMPPQSDTQRKLALLRRTEGSDWNCIEKLAERLIDIPHTLSMHCGGVVIAPGLLARSVPTVVSRKGLPTIQWEKDGAEDMGLVKIDLLGNRSLAVIRDAVKAVADATGLAESAIIPADPADDAATRDMIAAGQTFGVFYLESPSMRLLLRKAGKGDFRHTVIHSSIIRPAANAFINEYLERLHGKSWQPRDPSLTGLFDESYGIPVYQEDVVKLAMALAGYDYAQADKLRKCLGKRDAKQRLGAEYPALYQAARSRGVDKATLEWFWQTLMSMTGYSFCKPHSASYAQVSYEAAYLKKHYPAYFMAAVLSNGGGFYSVQSYVSETMRLGLTVLPPDVNQSAYAWRAENSGAVRTGFMAIAGLSKTAAETIIEERRKNGGFTGIEDFLKRAPVPVDDLRRIALAGGLDALAPQLNRPQILWLAGNAGAGQPKSGRIEQHLPSLFDQPAPSGKCENMDMLQPLSSSLAVPDLPDYSEQRRLAVEYSALGFIPGFHPLILHKKAIQTAAQARMRQRNPVLTSLGGIGSHIGETVTVLAWPVAAKIVETKHGDAMMFQSFEDSRSLGEAVIFPREFQRCHRLLGTLQPLWVTGKVLNEFAVPTLQVMKATTLC